MESSGLGDPSQNPPRKRSLHRAINLLNSKGQPTHAMEDAISKGDQANALTSNTPRDNSFGESIKRKVKNAGNSLKQFSSSGSSTTITSMTKRHGRCQSEVLATSLAARENTVPDKYKFNLNSHRVPSHSLTMNDSSAQHVCAEDISDPSTQDFAVPQDLIQGTPMTKVSNKKQKKVVVKLDPDLGRIEYESTKHMIIQIENIKELRSGSDARYYREQFQLAAELEDRWITIIYNAGYKILHLIAHSKDSFQQWDITLRKQYAIRQHLMIGLGSFEMREAVWEKQYWKSAEQKGQRLEFDDVEKMCQRLNTSPSRDDMLRRFKTADIHSRGYLDFEDFRRFVNALKARPELDRIYKGLCGGAGGKFDFSVFENFMRKHQKSTLSTAELQRLFVSFIIPPADISTKQDLLNPSPSPDSDVRSPDGLPTQTAVTWETGIWELKNFTAFLLSTDNSPFSDQNGKITMDMTRPLSEYYVSTSHNTYLVGNQLVGNSTIEGYIRALLHSCRSVELDIYDGDSEPMIYHGLTLTSKVSAKEVCEAIMKYAFVASPYPIIISAEIHCGLVQQDMLAKIMQDVFGSVLVSAPVDGRPKIDVLPSPEDLKGRVLLKAKNLYVSDSEGLRSKEVIVDVPSSETTSSYETEVFTDVKQEHESGFKKVLHRVARKRRSSSSKHQTNPQLDSSSNSFLKPPSTGEVSKVKMSVGLVTLLVYTVGVKCRGLNKKETYAPEHMFSLGETTANKLLKDGMMDLIKHNRIHLVRIYPKGFRVSSSNYEPHSYWSAGAQLVALNWQTCDLGVMINRAMFQRNGRAGYVLKPLALREVDKKLLSQRTTHSLKITVISAQQLPRPKDSSGREIEKGIIDPYVEVSVHVPGWTQSPLLPEESQVHYSPPTGANGKGATSARTVVSHKTGVVKNNGFNPVWEEPFSLPFDCVGGMKDLVFVRFEVKMENKVDDEPLALYVISLGSLRQGYRHLPLQDSQLSQYLFSTLFVHIQVVDD